MFLLGGTVANPSTIGSLRAADDTVIIDGGHLDLTSNDFSLSTSALIPTVVISKSAVAQWLK